MALPSLRRKAAPLPAPPKRVTVRANQTAAAALMRMEDSGWKSWKFGSSAWQVEAWRHLDICGELKSPTRAIASMVSRCRLYISKKSNGEPGAPADKPEIAALSETIYGSADERPELLWLAAANMFAVGEYFTYIESPRDADNDRWMIISTQQIKRAGGDPKLVFERPHKYGAGAIEYWIPEGRDKGRDKQRMAANTGLLIRSWTPHPQLPDHADSSVRSVLSVLNLIEQYNKRSSAQNDSRLAGAGVMFLPDSFDFPLGDHQSPTDAFEARLGDAMGLTLRDQANARSLVPIMATVDGKDIDKVKWMTFETPLDEQTGTRLDQCIRRLALGLDIPPELLLGTGTLNHWNAWMSEASTHKAFVAPILARICHSLTEGWLQPLLQAMNVDPDDYMVWFDMSPLTVRPDRQADALAMWDRGLINDEAARAAGNWTEGEAHTVDSYKIWLVSRAILANPALLADPNFASTLGIQPTPAGAAGVTEALPALESRTEQTAPNGGNPPDRTAEQEGLVSGAEMAALHSLAVAGKKLLTRGVRDELMHEFAGRTHELHTRLNVTDFDHAARLLDGTFDLLPQLSARTGTDKRILQDIIGFYCAGRMVANEPHNPDELTFYLSEGIMAAGHRFCVDGECHNRLNPQPCSARPMAVTA